MYIQIPKFGIIKEQNLEIKWDVSIIYGYNNSGKTTLLKTIHEAFDNDLMASFLQKEDGRMSVYIPTNRVVCSSINTKDPLPRDLEEFIAYQRDSYQDYSLHLKHIRDYLLSFESVEEFLCGRVNDIFELQLKRLSGRYSDGIENIINIYLCIIWMMTWDGSIETSSAKSLQDGLAQKDAFILIDEIEMFLHVKVQAKLISALKEDFKSAFFLLTTHSPLILTRYQNCTVYCISEGLLSPITEGLFYKDLDHVYESLFSVDEFPTDVAEDIAYLGRVIMGETPYDSTKINQITEYLQKNHPNVFQKYNRIIVRAQACR